jgi:L-lactate dehydrogenase (cytochrome)
LVLTVDLQVLGQRHKDIKNGMTVPPELTRLENLLDIATKPAWALSVLRAKRKTFGNISGHVAGMENVNSLSTWIAGQFDPALNWKDVEWIAGQWGGKLILKGILDVDDARMAVDAGADAILVSNHGGRQLDSAPSTASVLPAIIEAVGDRTEVYVDSGIRSGLDVLKFLGLGARACFIGRAYLYGLGAYGQAGVTKALQILREELSIAMALTGVTDAAKVPRSVILKAAPDEIAFSKEEPRGTKRPRRVFEEQH